jgi:AcrR family transcriptional regulator
MANKKHDTEGHKSRLLDALERSLGIVTAACKEVGISRNTFYTYYNTDEEFKRAVDEIYEIQTDFVENQLFKKIKEGSERSILWYMKYKGRKRGYTDNLDITTGGEPIKIIINTKGKGDDLDFDPDVNPDIE